MNLRSSMGSEGIEFAPSPRYSGERVGVRGRVSVD
jgi:hypothetical protein